MTGYPARPENPAKAGHQIFGPILNIWSNIQPDTEFNIRISGPSLKNHYNLVMTLGDRLRMAGPGRRQRRLAN